MSDFTRYQLGLGQAMSGHPGGLQVGQATALSAYNQEAARLTQAFLDAYARPIAVGQHCACSAACVHDWCRRQFWCCACEQLRWRDRTST